MKKPATLSLSHTLALLLILTVAILSCDPKQGGTPIDKTPRQPGIDTPLEVRSSIYEPYTSNVKQGMQGVDFEGLDDGQRNLALKLLNEIPCACGCRKTTVAECRVSVTDCDTGRQQADFIVDQVRAGRGEGQVTRGLYDLILRQRVRGGAGPLLSAIGPNQSKDSMVAALTSMIANVDANRIQNRGDELKDARLVAKLFLTRYSGIVKYLEGMPDELYVLHGITYELLPEGQRPMFEYYFFKSRPELQGRLFTYLNPGTSEADMIIGLAEDIFKQPEPRKGVDVEIGKSPVRGPEDATITIIEYSDFQCPFCSKAQGVINELWAAYPGKVKHVFKHFPLNFHKQAEPAARASMAAGKQGKFWEYRKILFDNTRELASSPFEKYAGQLGLDLEKFKQDMNSPELRAHVQNDMREAAQVSVQSTPTFFVNGVEIRGAQSLCAFIEAIE